MSPYTENAPPSPLARADSPFQKVVGWRVERWDADLAALSCLIEEKHLNRGGILYDGLIATRLDAAMGMAREGLVVARGRSVVFTAAEVVDADGRTIAESTGVFRRIEPHPFEVTIP